ncbi:3-oxoadipate enol-lactonase [Tropicimonas sp. S265A]|uniref:3-oxoadipate enol-lactonase n=1 Tax=Tropicimonas sp. S265A TaxID=3415134 RepID=UPI003C7DA740
MTTFTHDDVTIAYRDAGPRHGPTLVFANSLGTTVDLWAPILPLLPDTLRVIRYDMRGHGNSSVPQGAYPMGKLVGDAETLLDHLGVRDCAFVGLSIGGMVAQGLAVKRLDQVRTLVLSNTAAKIGQPKMWTDRIAAVTSGGLDAIVDGVMEKWFTRRFRDSPDIAPWRQMFLDTPVSGYTGCCAAIAGTDFYTPTSGLRLPTLGIAGNEDGSTPPDLVRETISLIPGARFELIRQAGHLPHVEQPKAYAALLTDFLEETGHV